MLAGDAAASLLAEAAFEAHLVEAVRPDPPYVANPTGLLRAVGDL